MWFSLAFFAFLDLFSSFFVLSAKNVVGSKGFFLLSSSFFVSFYYYYYFVSFEVRVKVTELTPMRGWGGVAGLARWWSQKAGGGVAVGA